MQIERRKWLQLAAAQAVCASVPSLVAAQTVQFDKDPFQLGIASGQPTAESVVLWTRLLPANTMRNPWADVSIAVEWELALDNQFAQVVQRGKTVAPPELSHSVHVDVEGLKENTVYWYRFRSGSAQSPIGRTRTLPGAEDVTTPLKVAFASCQRYHSGEFLAYDHMLADAPDLVVFLGDYIYEMGATQSERRGTWMYPASKISDYRELYELAKSDASLQRMHAACPWLIIWDDHEVLNDYAGEPVRLRKEGGRVARHMEMGYRTWYEHMPVSPKRLQGGVPGLLNNSHELRIYGTYRWGKLASFHLLDTRQYRSPQAGCGTAGLFKKDSCTHLDRADRQVLGNAQSEWLAEQLASNSIHQPGATVWNLICQPSVFSKFLIPVLGNVMNHDNWDGYPAARQHLLATIESKKTSNPAIFGGDIHQNWVTHVHRDADDTQSPIVAPEFCVTSITTPSFGGFTAEEMKAAAPHCLYTDRHQRGYALASLTAEKMTVTVRHVDITSNTARTTARFEVSAGSPVVRQLA
jgi:alkaline phosphatase D